MGSVCQRRVEPVEETMPNGHIMRFQADSTTATGPVMDCAVQTDSQLWRDEYNKFVNLAGLVHESSFVSMNSHRGSLAGDDRVLITRPSVYQEKHLDNDNQLLASKIKTGLFSDSDETVVKSTIELLQNDETFQEFDIFDITQRSDDDSCEKQISQCECFLVVVTTGNTAVVQDSLEHIQSKMKLKEADGDEKAFSLLYGRPVCIISCGEKASIKDFRNTLSSLGAVVLPSIAIVSEKTKTDTPEQNSSNADAAVSTSDSSNNSAANKKAISELKFYATALRLIKSIRYYDI